MGAATAAIALGSGLLGAYGSKKQAEAAKRAAEQPRYPEWTADDLRYIQDEARRLYDEGGGAPPPQMNLRRLRRLSRDEYRSATGRGGQGRLLTEEERATLSPQEKTALRKQRRQQRRQQRGTRGAGRGQIGAPAPSGGRGGGPRGGGGGPRGGGRRGRGVIGELNRRALEENPTIDAANAYIQAQLAGFDPSEYLDLFITGGDLDPESPIAQQIRGVYGQQFQEDMERYLAAQGDEFDTSGMFTSSMHALERGETRGNFGDALNRAILEAQLGVRGQNIDLLQGAMGFQTGLVGQVPALEEAEFIGLRAAADVEMRQREINAQKSIAAMQAAVQREAIAAQRAEAAAAQGRWEEAQAWQQEMQLAQLGHQNAMSEWEWNTGRSGQQLDDYLRRTVSIAGLGPERGTYGGSVGGSTALGFLGGGLAGAGLMMG